MTHLDFSRPAKDWDGDTFEEENENMAALALQSVAGDDEEEEDEEEKAAAAAIPLEEGVGVEPVAEKEEEDEEEEGVNELKDLERLEKAVKEDDLEGIGSLLGEEEEAM